MQQIFSSNAVLLIEAESKIDSLPSVVFITRLTSLFFIKSTILGLPSITFFIWLTLKPIFFITLAVPLVAIKLKSCSTSEGTISDKNCLSVSLTLIKTDPSFGISTPAPTSAFSKASANEFPIPITSPVDLISGPSIGSTF